MARGPFVSRSLHLQDLVSEQHPGTARFVDGTNGSDSNDGLSWDSPHATIQAAIDEATARDRVYVAPGGYDETLLVDVANLALIGMGGRGAAYVEPSAAGAEGMQVTADDVRLFNLGVAGEDAADYALNVEACARFRAYECKFEGPTGTIVLMDGTADDQAADVLLRDCEFAWGGSGIVFDDSGYGYPTQIRVEDCLFHNLTTAALGVAAGGLVKDLWFLRNMCARQEDGTEPTDYILLSDNLNTGHFAGNFFATATNAASVLTIGTGLTWGPNGTEAGWSTARPA